MPPSKEEKQFAEQDKHERQKRSAAIGQQVLHTLGQPGELQGVQVRPLWEDHYRVNVLVGPDAASSRVAHSYFLVVDSAGKVLTTTPTLRRHYGAKDDRP
jgi:hypothetical protein